MAKQIDSGLIKKYGLLIKAQWHETVEGYWKSLLSLVFFIIAFQFTPPNLYLISIAMIFLGSQVYFSIENRLIFKILGVATIIFGLSLSFLSLNLVAGWISFFVLLNVILLANYLLRSGLNLIETFIAAWINIFLFIVSLTFIFPFIDSSTNLIFSKSPQLSDFLFLLGVFSFILVALYSTISYIFYALGKIKGFEKLDNSYLFLALTIIFLIVACGLWGAKSFYGDDYPLDVKFSERVNQIYNFTCNSRGGYEYHLDNDKIVCDGKLSSIDGFSMNPPQLFARFDDSWIEIDFPDSFFEINESNPNILEGFQFTLYKEASHYQISIDFLNSEHSSMHRESQILRINSLSLDEYRAKMWNRVRLIAGILIVALFSVFSAVANLKKILEENSDKIK